MVSHDPARYASLHDEEIVGLARHGDGSAAEALVARYRPFVEHRACSYFVRGAERDDVIQEGMIGLCKAIHDFDQERLPSFRPFAELCVTRQILTAVKAAARHKHNPLNSSASLADIESFVESPEALDGTVFAYLAQLSDFEQQVLEAYLDGYSYEELGTQMGRTSKAIDNALQRIKRKVGKLIRAY